MPTSLAPAIKPRRIVFMGSPAFALPSLQRLAGRHEICAVYSQPPKKSGRGMRLTPVPVAAYAQEQGFALFTPTSLKSSEIIAQLGSHQADLFVVVAYGLLLPPEVLALPRFGCLNGHASLLPRWRGAAPIQRAIEAGDGETGVCAMLMEQGLDTGPVVAARRTEISSADTAASLHDRLAEMTAHCLTAVVDSLPNSIAAPQAQPSDGVTYASKISAADAAIDWRRDAAALDCHIRAFSPYPGAWCIGPRGRLRILTARPAPIDTNQAHLPAGHYLGTGDDDSLLVRCGDQALAISTLQPAGKTPMPARSFLNGVTLAVGDAFGKPKQDNA